MSEQKSNVILLHGRWPEKINDTLIAEMPILDSNNEENWMGWTKKKLEERGYAVSCPIVVDAWKARYEEWRDELDKERIDEHTILVGWSAGGYALVRYLGETGKNVKRLILIAPAYQAADSSEGTEDRELLPYEKEFYEYQVTSQLEARIQDRVVILVSNDSASILRAVEVYKRLLHAKEVKLENLGHFSFLMKELPELLHEIVS